MDETDVTEFGGFPLSDEVDVVACETCQKPVLREAYTYHTKNCALARDIADGRTSPTILKDVRGAADGQGMGADANAALALRRKMGGGKKNRGPINLDRQCGVINNKGLPCSRSLTCKSHSMGAKRNVQGRSKPYDELLFEWQKATNPAFVARLEEKERAIAAAKASSHAKDKKRKAGQDRRSDAAERDTPSARQAAENAMDMYMAHASYQDVDREMAQVLQTIHMAATRDRTTILPLATRSLAGQYTTRTKRFRVLRQFLAQGLSGAAHVHALRNEVIDGEKV